MESQKSLFLDFIRISAALVVLYGHAVLIFYGDTDSSPFLISNMRHFAVVLFFVLSGYVIGFTTKVNNRGAKQYTVARLSRLYSMLLPALVVTYFIEIAINYYNSNTLDVDFISNIRYLITFSFMNEFWFLSSAPRINGALWSVSFEFFFYLIFGVYLFTNTKIKKIIYTCIAGIFAGPKILLMFPIWISGYLAFVYNDKLLKFKSYFFFILCLLATYVSYLFLKPYPYLIGYKPFYFANQFLTDFITGLLFALSIMVLPENKELNISDKFVKQFREIADYTFPIYILHYPILKLCKALMEYKLHLDIQFYLSLLISLLISVLLGKLFGKFRSNWTEFFNYFFKMRTLNFILKKNNSNSI